MIVVVVFAIDANGLSELPQAASESPSAAATANAESRRFHILIDSLSITRRDGDALTRRKSIDGNTGQFRLSGDLGTCRIARRVMGWLVHGEAAHSPARGDAPSDFRR